MQTDSLLTQQIQTTTVCQTISGVPTKALVRTNNRSSVMTFFRLYAKRNKNSCWMTLNKSSWHRLTTSNSTRKNRLTTRCTSKSTTRKSSKNQSKSQSSVTKTHPSTKASVPVREAKIQRMVIFPRTTKYPPSESLRISEVSATNSLYFVTI